MGSPSSMTTNPSPVPTVQTETRSSSVFVPRSWRGGAQEKGRGGLVGGSTETLESNTEAKTVNWHRQQAGAQGGVGR